MLRNHYCVITKSEDSAYRLMRIAANHNLYGAYKIGVYGTERQHELFVTGTPWNYRKFMKEVRNIPDEEDVPKEEA